MTTLSNEDKISIVNQHIRTVEYNKYNIELSLIEENSILSPNSNVLQSLNDQLAEFNTKLEALQNEKALLEG